MVDLQWKNVQSRDRNNVVQRSKINKLMNEQAEHTSIQSDVRKYNLLDKLFEIDKLKQPIDNQQAARVKFPVT